MLTLYVFGDCPDAQGQLNPQSNVQSGKISNPSANLFYHAFLIQKNTNINKIKLLCLVILKYLLKKTHILGHILNLATFYIYYSPLAC